MTNSIFLTVSLFYTKVINNEDKLENISRSRYCQFMGTFVENIKMDNSGWCTLCVLFVVDRKQLQNKLFCAKNCIIRGYWVFFMINKVAAHDCGNI